jgi:hypothetical protein
MRQLSHRSGVPAWVDGGLHPGWDPLGTQRNNSADPTNPAGMHLHFSTVQDDGIGRFGNELDFAPTLDPTPTCASR